MNFHRLFVATIEGFDATCSAIARQAALGGVGLV